MCVTRPALLYCLQKKTHPPWAAVQAPAYPVRGTCVPTLPLHHPPAAMKLALKLSLLLMAVLPAHGAPAPGPAKRPEVSWGDEGSETAPAQLRALRAGARACVGGRAHVQRRTVPERLPCLVLLTGTIHAPLLPTPHCCWATVLPTRSPCSAPIPQAAYCSAAAGRMLGPSMQMNCHFITVCKEGYLVVALLRWQGQQQPCGDRPLAPLLPPPPSPHPCTPPPVLLQPVASMPGAKARADAAAQAACGKSGFGFNSNTQLHKQ